ncbi:hypothetical protein RchiOBHm_Chr5g0000201 [Rosa chinensis]|uniref:Uncharacterized protein n=1 Tax=Rosa chinensis TaxID=74649 RepID=A0A2P6Q1Y1_ROSCH|nr:hypothetical protein RchiOBHm_Chr5g0000201 [Rosa chinensis]
MCTLCTSSAFGVEPKEDLVMSTFFTCLMSGSICMYHYGYYRYLLVCLYMAAEGYVTVYSGL